MKGLKNSLFAFIANSLAILIGFIAQRVFVNTLGAEYLGLNGLFLNIMSMLGIAELGLGSAIIYNLYKPIKTGDQKTVKSLVKFYQKAYRYIALAVSIVGLAFMPFLRFFVGDINIPVNIYLVFGLFIADTVATYILSYRRSILYADQKNYLISLAHIGYLVVLNTAQILLLLLTKNYYFYLIAKIVANLAENCVIFAISKKRYPYLSEKAEKLPEPIKADIVTKIKALLLHKIGTFVVLGSDNLIISRFLGIVTVGLYSNYAMIISAANTVLGQTITALTPTVGHLLVEKNQAKNFMVFRRIRAIVFVAATLASLGLLCLATPFITLWLGKDYLLSNTVLVVLTINFFQSIMRYAFATFKEAAGIYHEDRFIPLIESAINIVASIALVQFLGLPGVFIGTILSSLILWCFSYPKFVYKPLFGRSYRQYALETLSYFAIFAAILIPVFLLLTNLMK